jgi:ribonuclease HI
MLNIIDVFTDGSAINNSQNSPTGSAVYIPKYEFLVSMSEFGTNNTAELHAIQYALYLLKKNFNYFKPNTVNIISDSKYAINVITSVYKAKVNKEFIAKCQKHIKFLKEHDVEVNFKWVRAHTCKTDYDSKCNAVVDKAAHDEAEKLSSTNIPIQWHRN